MSEKALELSLPAPIALPLARQGAAATATDKVHAMADTLEAALRYLTYVTAADLFSLEPEAPELALILSESFHQAAQLGSWERAFREHTLALLRHQAFVSDVLAINDDREFSRLVGKLRDLRNQKIHRPGSAARFSGESDQILMSARPPFLLLLEKLAFLADYELLAVRRVGALGPNCYEAVRFMGADCLGAYRVMYWSAPDGSLVPENVPILCRRDGTELLSLWPFLHVEFAPSTTLTPSLFVLAGFHPPFEGFVLESRNWLYASVGPPEFRSLGPGPRDRRSRYEWLASEARSQLRRTAGPASSSLLACLDDYRPHWEGRDVTGAKGTYHVGRFVASGGVGSIYTATDKENRPLCIKFVRLGNRYDEKVFLRFQRQIDAFQRCGDHPYLVNIHDHGRWSSSEGIECFLVMDWVAGGDLSKRVEQWGELGAADDVGAPLETRVGLFIHVAEAVAHLHANQLIHRDIKPSNVLLTTEDRPLLADLDLVGGQFSSPAQERITSIGTPVGTPSYMSPEQRAGQTNLGASSDIYALGLLLYELVMATPAFPHLRADARGSTLAEFSRKAGSKLGKIFDRCTRESASERYQHAGELLLALGAGRALEIPVAPPLFATPVPPSKPAAPPITSAPRGQPDDLVPWDLLPADERTKITRVIQHIQARDFARLNLTLLGLSSLRKGPLMRAIHDFGRAAVKLKLDITADNRAEIESGLEACLAPFEAAGLFAAYADTLRPVVRSFATLFVTVARSGSARAAIIEQVRKFSVTVHDNALARSLDEFERPTRS
jgi:serine/threonine protein kinase